MAQGGERSYESEMLALFFFHFVLIGQDECWIFLKFDILIVKYIKYTNIWEKSHENSILWLDIVLSGICSEIEKVNTQFVVGKFCNKNPVVFPKKGI